MKTFFISASGLDARGVGPRIMGCTAPLLIAAIITEWMQTPFARISLPDNRFIPWSGWILLALGIVAFITSLVQFIVNFPKGKLITSGMFAISRNPIYVCWILFILPALGVIFSNWLFFASAFCMLIATQLLVKKEEEELSGCFGNAYLTYKSQVRRIIGCSKNILFR
jgi:protein-S-isoprenylcysteine O-methyltransferase Ste14